jgi:flavin reductase (DIM6/NTAB) family NADH-FMN oxidoreductase RutF
VSLEPPLILVSLIADSYPAEVLGRACGADEDSYPAEVLGRAGGTDGKSYPAEVLGGAGAAAGEGGRADGNGDATAAGGEVGGERGDVTGDGAREEAGGRFAVTVLAAGQRMLAGRFAASGRPGARLLLDDVPHRRGEHSGALIVAGGLAALECVVSQLIPAGDHLVVIARVTSVAYVADSGDPLIRFRGRYPAPGKLPGDESRSFWLTSPRPGGAPLA